MKIEWKLCISVKPVKLRFKIDLVSHPVDVEGLINR